MKNFVLILLLGLVLTTAGTAGAIISKKNTELDAMRQEKASIQKTLEEKQPVIVVDRERFENKSTAEFQGKHVTFKQKLGDEGVSVIIKETENYFSDSIHLTAREAETVANELASGLLGIKFDAFSCTSTMPVVK